METTNSRFANELDPKENFNLATIDPNTYIDPRWCNVQPVLLLIYGIVQS